MYAIVDLFSRWMAADCESDELAESLISTLLPRADSLWRAASRIDMRIVKRHYRPYTSDNTPYIAAQFKTRKYPLRISGVLQLPGRRARRSGNAVQAML